MSRNLRKLADARSHEADGRGRGGADSAGVDEGIDGVRAPTAVAMLGERIERLGELADDDLRDAAAASGLPEAAVYGVADFYDDLVAPRGRRHVRVCTGTACFAATGGAHVDDLSAALDLAPGERAADGSESLAETFCLGFCHSSPALRVGEVVDAGPDVVERVINDTQRPADEPAWASTLDEPVLTRPGDWSGLRHALAHHTPESLLAEVERAGLTGRGGAAFPAGLKWRAARTTASADKFIVANGDEGDPGSYIDKHLMERSPALILEGMALAAYAVGAARGYVLARSEYPLAGPTLEAAAARARTDGLLGEDIQGSGFSFDVTIVRGAGSYVVGEETALLACIEGQRGTVAARPPYPAQSGLFGRPTVVNNVETFANVPFIALRGADEYRSLSPGESAGTKLICFNERFANPGVYEVSFGTPLRELCDDLAGGPAAHAGPLKAVQIGGPLGGILPTRLLDTPFDFDALGSVGCMLGHGSIVGFDAATNMRDVARHLLRFGARESCGKCMPCRIGLHRSHEMFAGDAPVDRALLDPLLETLELGSLCGHGSGMPAPIRSLIEHFPDELRLV